eukprot:231268-Rhodomonas_salina.1
MLCIPGYPGIVVIGGYPGIAVLIVYEAIQWQAPYRQRRRSLPSVPGADAQPEILAESRQYSPFCQLIERVF